MSQFDNVSVVKQANVYFDGEYVSHTVVFADGTKKTVGVIMPSALTFNTGAPEIMECVGGWYRSDSRARRRGTRMRPVSRSACRATRRSTSDIPSRITTFATSAKRRIVCLRLIFPRKPTWSRSRTCVSVLLLGALWVKVFSWTNGTYFKN